MSKNAEGQLPAELEKRSQRLQELVERPGSLELALAAASRQHEPVDLKARLEIAKELVSLLRRFRYEETGEIADLLLALDASEGEWIQTVQRAVYLLRQLMEAVRDDVSEELFHYGVREEQLPELEADVQQVVERYLKE